jgi:cobalt-zinc-cadmium efflux system outer membrane protein
MGTRLLTVVVCGVLSLSMPRELSAQQPSDPTVQQHQDLSMPRRYAGPPLSLAEALQEAGEHNPEILVARARVAVAAERPAQARSLGAPMLRGQIWQWPLNSLNPASVNMYMLTASQELPGKAKRDLRAAVSEKDVALAEADVAVEGNRILEEVKRAYEALFLSRRAIDIHLASAGLLGEVADVSQAKYEAGRLSQADVLKAVVEISKLHGDVIQFEADASMASAMLNALLGRAQDSPIGPLAEPAPQTALPSVAELQRLAAERHPVLQRDRLGVEKGEAQLASTRLERKPDFSIEGGYMLMPRMGDAWTASVGMSWPNAPWARRGIDARLRESSAAISASKASALADETQVRLAVQQGYVRLAAARDRAELLRTTILPQARQALDVSRAAYENDRGDFQSLIDSERMVLDFELDYLRALTDQRQGRAQLERAIGGPLPSASAGPDTTPEVKR